MKYRGLTYNREKESYEWVYGMPSYGYETDEIAEIGTVYGDFREIFPDTLGEQTPYRDKNGKEIYTGDIVALEVGGQIREFVVDKATVDREYNTLQGFTGKDGSNTVKAFTFNTSDGRLLHLSDFGSVSTDMINKALKTSDGKWNTQVFADYQGVKSVPSEFYADGAHNITVIFRQGDIGPAASGTIYVPLGKIGR